MGFNSGFKVLISTAEHLWRYFIFYWITYSVYVPLIKCLFVSSTLLLSFLFVYSIVNQKLVLVHVWDSKLLLEAWTVFYLSEREDVTNKHFAVLASSQYFASKPNDRTRTVIQGPLCMFLLLYILSNFSSVTVLYLCTACGLLNVTSRYFCTSVVGNLFTKDKLPNFVALRKNGERQRKSRLIISRRN